MDDGWCFLINTMNKMVALPIIRNTFIDHTEPNNLSIDARKYKRNILLNKVFVKFNKEFEESPRKNLEIHSDL